MSIKLRAIQLLTVTASCLSAASLTYLVPQSDAIVVATQTAVARSGANVTFNLAVERVLKGSVSVGSAIPVTFTSPHQIGSWGGTPSYRGIWFLQQHAGGGWTCLPAASHGNMVHLADLSFPVSSGPLPSELSYDPSSTAPTDQIVFELGAAQPADPSLILRATYDVGSPSVHQALQYMAGNRPGDLALVGLAGLIQHGDVPSLMQVEQTAAAIDLASHGGQEVVSAINATFRNADATGVASLGRMATSVGVPAKLQSAAAAALSAIHSPEAVPYLGLLLSGTSAQLQLYGAQGISFFVNGVGIVTPQTMPSMSHLNSRQPSSYYSSDTMRHIGPASNQEASYIAYWQAWWQQHPELHAVK